MKHVYLIHLHNIKTNESYSIIKEVNGPITPFDIRRIEDDFTNCCVLSFSKFD